MYESVAALDDETRKTNKKINVDYFLIAEVKSFVRHIRTMFYVRIKFSHSFKFQTNSSKSVAEISEAIVKEIKDRTHTLQEIFNYLTSAASLFFIFIIFKYVCPLIK